jgi:hypothetical protein
MMRNNPSDSEEYQNGRDHLRVLRHDERIILKIHIIKEWYESKNRIYLAQDSEQ